MVMFAETKAQHIAEDALLSTEEKIAQLSELDARLDASRSRPRCLVRSVCNNARWWQLLVFGALRKAFSGLAGPMSKKARALINCWANRYPQFNRRRSIVPSQLPLHQPGRLKS